jgi:phage terminase large subunit
MTTYRIVELQPTETGGFCPRGGAAQLWRCKDPEVMLSGPAETGKTFSSLKKLDACMWKYAGAQGAIVRKTYATMTGSVLQTFERKILGPSSPVRIYGGEKAQWYDYPNGARIWVGGMDNPQKVLSSERDIIYVNQAEELEREDWQTLTTRATGRAGNMPYGQTFGDCNPDTPLHWIRTRPSLTRFESHHEDNPMLFDDAGGITDQGQRSLAVLDALEGVEKERLRYGKWVQASGLVYDVWSDGPLDGNVTEAADYIPDGGRVLWGVDDGYAGVLDPKTGTFTANSHPRVFLLCQQRANGQLCVFAESYAIQKLDDEHIADVLALPYPKPDAAAVDKSAAQLKGRIWNAGIATLTGPTSVEESIKNLRRFIASDQNKMRGILVHPRCEHLRKEFASYRRDDTTGHVVKEWDHGVDAIRYLAWALRYEA